MEQKDKAIAFASLHEPGKPICLYNIWDAGTARAVAEAGARAIATGSWSVAAAHGYDDGETIPLDLVLRIVERIAAAVPLPVTVDFEGGYAAEPETLETNIQRLLATGVIGINFEDRIVRGDSLYSVAKQVERIAALRRGAESFGVPLFINARTDLFLREKDASRHGERLEEAKERATAYAEAGASGFFAPGLKSRDWIAELTREVSLPLNIMMKPGAPEVAELAGLGVARVSWGPGPFFEAMVKLKEAAVT